MSNDNWADQPAQYPDLAYRDHPQFAAWRRAQTVPQADPATTMGRRLRQMQHDLDQRADLLAAADARNHMLEEAIDTLTDERDAARAFAATLAHAGIVPRRRQRAQDAREAVAVVLLGLLGLGGAVAVLWVVGGALGALRGLGGL